MNLFKESYEKYFPPYEQEDIHLENDYDIIATDLINRSLILLSKVHDEITITFSQDNNLDSYKKTFQTARDNIIKVTELTLAICHRDRNKLSNKADILAGGLQIIETSYYDEDETLLKKVAQITKFTNKNSLQSLVIRAISGERYDMDLNVLREHLFNTTLGYSRLLEKIKFIDFKDIEDNLLELLIFITSLNILFNIETTDLCQ